MKKFLEDNWLWILIAGVAVWFFTRPKKAKPTSATSDSVNAIRDTIDQSVNGAQQFVDNLLSGVGSVVTSIGGIYG